MKKVTIAVIVLLIAAITGILILQQRTSKKSSLQSKTSLAGNFKNIHMKITSPVFRHNQPIPSKYTCDGDGINPPLQIDEAPAEAKSLLLIVDDPDAPAKTWVHWVVWNIKPDTAQIIENSVPAGAVEGQTDFGRSGWGGPCPPSGSHRYFFKLYALDTELNLPETSSKQEVEQAMQGHLLDQAELVGLYEKQQ